MKKKFTINPKLKTYSTLASSFLAASNLAEAAIVYHDVNPDVTKTQTTIGVSAYPVDMDNDGTTDFTLSVTKGSGTSGGYAFSGTAVAIEMSNSNNNVVFKSTTIGTKTFDYAAAMNANDNINNALSWYSTSNATKGLALAATGTVTVNTFPVPVSVGQFQNVTDKYIGVRFQNNANTYYGWIRVDVGNYNTFTIKDWAYEDTPGQAILAGAGIPTEINSVLNSFATIKNINNIIEAEFASIIEGQVQIINVSGVVVKSADFNGNSFSINMQEMPSGIYSILVSAKEGIAAKKVFVE